MRCRCCCCFRARLISATTCCRFFKIYTREKSKRWQLSLMSDNRYRPLATSVQHNQLCAEHVGRRSSQKDSCPLYMANRPTYTMLSDEIDAYPNAILISTMCIDIPAGIQFLLFLFASRAIFLNFHCAFVDTRNSYAGSCC
jgi:hypothetical protein